MPTSLGALQEHRDLSLAFQDGGRLLGRADRGRLVDLDAGELDSGVTLDHVDRRLRGDRDAGGVGRYRELPDRAVGIGGHQQHAALRPRLDAVLDAVDPVTGRGARGRGHAGRQGSERAARFVDRPRTDQFAGHQRFDEFLVPRRRLHQPRQHDADRVQRAGCNGVPDLLGDHRQVGDAVARDAATAQLLRHQQARPAQFGCPLPPFGLERHLRCVQSAHVGQGALLLQKRLGGRGEQHLFRGGGHGISSAFCR